MTSGIFDEIVKFVGQIVVVGGGAATISLLLFQWLGKQWLETWFQKNLATHENALDRQLEDHRYQINSLFSRVSKIHEKEFDVLPTAWIKLQGAYENTVSILQPLQTYPNLDRMTSAEIEEFLNTSWLKYLQTEQLRSTENKLELYNNTFAKLMKKRSQEVR